MINQNAPAVDGLNHSEQWARLFTRQQIEQPIENSPTVKKTNLVWF